MTSPELIEFIKNQLQSGVGKAEITNILLKQGWIVSDVEEGFVAINVQTTPTQIIQNLPTSTMGQIPKVAPISMVTTQPKRRSFIVLIIVISVLVLLSAGGAYLYMKSQSAKVSVPSAQSTSTPPAISSLNPNSGQVGTVVTVAGSGFDNGSQVSFDASGGNVGSWHIIPQSVSENSLTFIVPTGVPSGSYVVMVAKSDGDLGFTDSNHSFFTVTGSSGSQAVKGPNTAKADDSAIGEDIKQLAMMAEQFSLDHNMTYVGFCTDTSKGVDLIWNDLTSRNVSGQNGIRCKATASGYIISSTLNSGAYACANSAVSVKINLAAFPTGMDCSGPTVKASATPAGTPTPVSGLSATSGSIAFDAKVIGGTLSKTDRDAIIAGTMNMVSALNSGNPTLFRKYAAIITPPDQMDALNKMTDQQLLSIMNAMGKTATKDISPASLSSADATWSIIDSNNVGIKIQLAPVGAANVSETIQAMKINGVWY